MHKALRINHLLSNQSISTIILLRFQLLRINISSVLKFIIKFKPQLSLLHINNRLSQKVITRKITSKRRDYLITYLKKINSLQMSKMKLWKKFLIKKKNKERDIMPQLLQITQQHQTMLINWQLNQFYSTFCLFVHFTFT